MLEDLLGFCDSWVIGETKGAGAACKSTSQPLLQTVECGLLAHNPPPDPFCWVLAIVRHAASRCTRGDILIGFHALYSQIILDLAKKKITSLDLRLVFVMSGRVN